MFNTLVMCETQSHFNAVLILFFILGYLCLKYYTIWKKTEDYSSSTSNTVDLKARYVQDLLMKHQSEDQDFFNPSLE